MPEGPETRRDADKIGRALKGLQINEVFFKFDHLKKYEKKFLNSTLMQATTKGKGFILIFDNGFSIYCHLQLYGKWHIGKTEKKNTKRDLRMKLGTSKKAAFLYSASTIEVLPSEEIHSLPYFKNLGPDVLDASTEEILNVLNLPRFQRRTLGQLFLDQKFLAGMGNYLRTEILFLSKLDPKAKLGPLENSKKKELAKITRDVTLRSYRTGGKTVTEDILQRRREERVSRYESLRFYVFGREGKKCPVCAGKIAKTMVGGRRFYFCEECLKGHK